MKVLHLIILSELNTWTEVFQNRTKLLHFVVIHEASFVCQSLECAILLFHPDLYMNNSCREMTPISSIGMCMTPV